MKKRIIVLCLLEVSNGIGKLKSGIKCNPEIETGARLGCPLSGVKVQHDSIAGICCTATCLQLATGSCALKYLLGR